MCLLDGLSPIKQAWNPRWTCKAKLNSIFEKHTQSEIIQNNQSYNDKKYIPLKENKIRQGVLLLCWTRQNSGPKYYMWQWSSALNLNSASPWMCSRYDYLPDTAKSKGSGIHKPNITQEARRSRKQWRNDFKTSISVRKLKSTKSRKEKPTTCNKSSKHSDACL